MAAKMKDVTTLADRKRRDELLEEDSDDDLDAWVAKQKEQPVAAAAIVKAPIVIVDHYFVFVQPCVALSCDRAVVQHLMDQHPDAELAHCLQLRLSFSPGSTDQIFRLCFHENEHVGILAEQYLRHHLSSGEHWLCTHALALEVISSLGTSTQLGMSWKEMVKWTVESLTEDTGNRRLYVCNQALHRVRTLLELISLSYSSAAERLAPTCKRTTHEDTLKLLELLLLLNCDATIQEHFPHLAAETFTSVLAYCRRVETQELALLHVPSTGGLSALQLTAPPLQAQDSDEANNENADEVEDNILSQDMQEKATISPSMPISPTRPGAIDVTAAAFPYTNEWLKALPEHSMSTMLVQTLRGVIQREDVSLHLLSSMCGLLAQHPDFNTLWRAFTASVFTLRVAPYFPSVEWSSFASSNAGFASGDGGCSASDSITYAAFVALIVASVNKLQSQYDESLTTSDTTDASTSCECKMSMWSEMGDVIALFRLIHRYILVLGDELESALLEDLEDTTQEFKKTKCGESQVLDTIDMIKATCELFLDC